jgi:hypothetical protein
MGCLEVGASDFVFVVSDAKPKWKMVNNINYDFQNIVAKLPVSATMCTKSYVEEI